MDVFIVGTQVLLIYLVSLLICTVSDLIHTRFALFFPELLLILKRNNSNLNKYKANSKFIKCKITQTKRVGWKLLIRNRKEAFDEAGY